MTEAQLSLYRRRWGKVRKLLRTLGEFSPKDADAERHVITREALNYDKSSLDFTNKEFDKVLAKLDERLVLLEGPKEPKAEDAEDLKRMIWSLVQSGFNDAYLNKISADQYGVASWRDLSLADMRKLRITITQRSRAKNRRKAAPRPENEPF